jgi:hypothetical protein
MRARAHGVNVKNLAKSEENQLAGAVLAVLESLAAQGVLSPSMGLAMDLEPQRKTDARCRIAIAGNPAGIRTR